MMTMQPMGTWMLVALLTLGAQGATAQSPTDPVVEQLREQGYVDFEVSRTLLGRFRVIAQSPDGGQREIVFNPSTGEILRDYFEAADGAPAPRVMDRPDDAPAAPSDEADDEDRSQGGNAQGNGNAGGNGNGGGNGDNGNNGNGSGGAVGNAGGNGNSN